MAEIFQENKFETDGELLTAQRLRDELPKQWKIITNKMFTSDNGTTHEVDFIIVGKHRIFVADDKAYYGKIHGDDTNWIRESGKEIKNPLGNVAMVAKKVAGHLRKQIPWLKEEIGDDHFVDAVVILSNPSVQLLTQGSHRSKTLLLNAASQKLIDFDKGNGNSPSLVQFHDDILKSLGQLSNAPLLPKKISAYNIKEKLEGGPHYRAFSAEHEASGPNRLRRLKVYALLGLDEKERECHKKLIYHDFEALTQLAAEGLAPAVDPAFLWEDERFIVVPQHPVSLPSLRALSAPAGTSSDSEPLLPLEALNAGRALLKTLARLHELKILHRNLTPDNVFVDRSTTPWRAVLADFDFARLPETETITPLTKDLEFTGPYSAPELAFSLALASEKSDVYAAGIILTELLANGKAQDMTDKESGQIQVPELNLDGCELEKDSGETLRDLLQSMVCRDQQERWDSVQAALELMQEQAPKVELEQEKITAHSNKPQETVEVDNFSYHTPRLFQRGDIIDKQYEVEGMLGHGATATTYLVRDRVYGGNYVLKQIKDASLAHRFAGAEFNVLRHLTHPVIMRIYDVKLPESAYHLKSEFVEGKSLHDMQNEFPWLMDRVLSFGKDILDALAYLEKNGIAHRDLSARNIIVTKHDRPKLIDFGLASDEDKIGYTQVGTIAYRAPELDYGKPWNPTCDIYSAGVLLFWTLTGKQPFEASPYGLPDKSRFIQLPISETDDPRLPVVLNVLRRAMATSPKDRFQSATEMATALNILEAPGTCNAVIVGTSNSVITRTPHSVITQTSSLVSKKCFVMTVRGCDSYDAEGKQFSKWSDAYNAAIVIRKAFSEDIYDKLEQTKWHGNGKTAFWLGNGPHGEERLIHIDPHHTGQPNPIDSAENSATGFASLQFNSVTSSEDRMTQRDKMRQLFRLFGGDKEAVIEAYANAEQVGEVNRLRNTSDYGTRQYARALWNDGKKKGWL